MVCSNYSVSLLFGGLRINPANAAVGFQFVEDSLTTDPVAQANPDMYQYGLNNYAVVRQDNRNGQWDIYITWFGYGVGNTDPGDQPTSSPPAENSIELSSQTVIVIGVVAVAAVAGIGAILVKRRSLRKLVAQAKTS